MRTYFHSLPYGLKYIDQNTIRKEATLSLSENLHFMEALCNSLINCPDPMVVPIFNFHIGTYSKGIYHYSYDMLALLSLYQEEKNLVNWSEEAYYRNGVLPSQSTDERIQVGWDQWPDLMQFIEKWITLRRHRDIHDGNILIDEEDNYRIIDLEGFIHSSLDSPINSWINKLGANK